MSKGYVNLLLIYQRVNFVLCATRYILYWSDIKKKDSSFCKLSELKNEWNQRPLKQWLFSVLFPPQYILVLTRQLTFSDEGSS